VFPVGRKNAATFRGNDDWDARTQAIVTRCTEADPRTASLCQLLVHTDGMRTRIVTRDEKAIEVSDPRFPWLTPLLGSGTTGGLDSATLVRGLALLAIGALAEEGDRLIATRYAAALVEQRLALPSQAVETPAFDPRAGESELGPLLLAAAWATKVYHRIRAEGDPVVGSQNEPRAALATARISHDILLFDAFVDPALRALDLAIASLAQTLATADVVTVPMRRARDLLVKLRDGLKGADEVSIELVHVRALTEFTWMRLSTPLAPGWNDLLWNLFIETGTWPPPDGLHGPRPLTIGLEHASDAVADRLAGRSLALDVHHAVADVLTAQAQLAAKMDRSSETPTPSAFVTTFGLELEDALLQAGQPFVMAMPMNVAVGNDRTLVWIGCSVEPGKVASLEQLGTDPDSWFVLRNSSSFRLKPYARLPFVVRVTGSPLITPPVPDRARQLAGGLQSLLGATKRLPEALQNAAASELELTHALLLDEFVALDQSAGLLRWEPATDGQTKNVIDYRLPKELTTSDFGRRVFRYWMLLGVQMGDPAIRHSVAMQFGVDAPPGVDEGPFPLRNGISVQSRATGEAEDLLHQLGLDVVLADVNAFLPDLRHYCTHVLASIVEWEKLDSEDRKKAMVGGRGLFPLEASRKCRIPVESKEA
jgi:hypothetical protein